MDKLIINNLLARGIIGVYDWERKEPQDILVSLILFTDFKLVCETDRVEDSVDYAMVANKVLAFIQSSKRYTVEALAGDLALLCLDIPGVKKVRVRVEKPGVISFADSVGVELERKLP